MRWRMAYHRMAYHCMNRVATKNRAASGSGTSKHDDAEPNKIPGPAFIVDESRWGQAHPDVAAVIKRGSQLVASGRLTEAQGLYEHALLTSPDNPDLRFGLGTVFFRERNWPKAIENYRSSINARPGSVKALYYLAEAFFMEADVDRARQTIAMAASLAPEDAQICQRYGEYLVVNIDNRKEGLAWMEKARRLDPSLPRVDFDIARTHFDLTDYQSAIPDFEAALKRDPGNGEAAFYLAESWANLGDWDKARDFYSYATTHHYEKGTAFYGLGRAYVELGASEVAVSSFAARNCS